MKTRLFVSMIAILVADITLAQEIEKPSTSYQHDLGFNTNFIFQGLFQSQPQAPFAVMYKKYKTENNALRLGADLSFYSTNNSGTVTNSSFSDNSYGSIALTIGFEKQKVLGGKWMWYYGIDAVPSLSFNQSTSFNNNLKTGSTKNSSLGLGARPFLGIRFNINSRLYVAAEATAMLAYVSSKNVQKTYNPEQTVRDMTTSNVNFSLTPASGIFIFYRF